MGRRRPPLGGIPARAGAVGVALAALSSSPAIAASHSTDTPACMAAPSAVGDWPLGGHDLANTRAQPAETRIGPVQAATLTPAWVFDTGQKSGATGLNLADENGTPVEAGGCVFVGSGTVSDASKPAVYALAADTGKVVWGGGRGVATSALGGTVVGSVAVDGPRVIALVNQKGDGHGHGPYAIALDRSTGALLWQSPPLATATGSYTNATPTVANGVVIAGFSAAEGFPDGHGGFGLIDDRSGTLLARTYTIPPADWIGPGGEHYGGGGIWTTPAVDAATGYSYMGTGNPYSKRDEHPNTNAIIKVDIDRHRLTFGRIVGSYKGNIDQATEVVRQASRPTCALLPDDPLRQLPQSGDRRLNDLQGFVGNSHGCVQLDLDFGAGANLIRQPDGHLVVGDLQKSGVYHAVDAVTMQRRWASMIGLSCQVYTGSSTAYDAARRAIVGDVGPGSALAAMASQSGALRWYSPIGDGFHYGGVSVSDGVAYSVDQYGNLDIVDEATGALLMRQPMTAEAGPDAANISSSGVSIARGMVFAEAGNHVVAFRPAHMSSVAVKGTR
ncbi:MAG: hypothetical protein NVS1B12_17480 [Acidimicrobiales bacterium]